MIIILGRHINCNKHITLVQDADNKGGNACVGARIHGKPLYFLLNFGVYLKCLLKSVRTLNEGGCKSKGS